MTVHLTDRAVIEVTGPEARPFLQGLLTSDMDALAGGSVWAGLLSPQGKALFELFVHDSGDRLFLDVAAVRAEALLKRLTMYKLRREVTLSMSSLNVLWADAASAREHPSDPRLPGFGARWLGAETGGNLSAYHSARLRAGLPEAEEIGVDQTLWLECNAAELNGVSFTKGCYVGQENTARMHHRDRIRRRLLPVRLTAEPTGSAITTADGKSAGELRGHFGDVAFAWLRMEYIDTALTVHDAPAKLIRPAWLLS